MRAPRILALFVGSLFLAACGGGSGGSGGGAGGGNGPGGLLTAPHAPSRLLVMLEDPEDAHEIEEIRQKLAGVTMERIAQTAFFVMTVPAGTNLEATLKEAGDDLRVVVSEPDYLGEAPEGDPATLPVRGGDLVGAIPTQGPLGALDLASAHAASTGAGVTVAVLDTGIDFNHPAFAPGRIAPGGFDFIEQDTDPTDVPNGADDDGDGIADEQFGHGTFIASLVLAVAPDATILPVRVLDAEGFGTASSVAAGIVWAVDAGARVINLSVDFPEESEVIKDAVKYASERDVLIVAPAGNDGLDLVLFPARFGDVLAVAAVDPTGRRSPFSNFGSKIDLVAPGEALIGAVPPAREAQGTLRWSGTSFATPLVAGAAALVRSIMPGLAQDQVAARLTGTAQPVDGVNPGMAGKLGRGLVQPAAALQ